MKPSKKAGGNWPPAMTPELANAIWRCCQARFIDGHAPSCPRRRKGRR